MIILDANILLYSHFPSFRENARTRDWLEQIISAGDQSVGLPWQSVTAFIRISTNHKAFVVPATIEDVADRIEKLLAHSMVQIVSPTTRHWEIFANLLKKEQAYGDLVVDAHLAALAIEHGATLATTDRDFSRFSKLKTINPMV